MFPCFPLDYLRNHCIADVVLSAELAIDAMNRHPFFANIPDIILGQLGRSIQFPPMVASPSAMLSVCRVISFCSRSKMDRVTASRVVARMQDKWNIIGDGSVDKNVDKAVSENKFPPEPTVSCTDKTVTSFVARSPIWPASKLTAAVVDMAQYQLNLLWGKLVAHCTVLSCDVIPSAVDAARGFYSDNYTLSLKQRV